MDKAAFISADFFQHISKLQPCAIPKWGKMHPQQMVEHLADFIDLSTEKIIFPLAVPETDLPKYKAFLMSDKQFRENTKAPSAVLGDEPLPVKYDSLETAIMHLKKSVSDFFVFFAMHPDQKTLHPAFGLLNYDEWLVLHFKHLSHHLHQFELMPDN